MSEPQLVKVGIQGAQGSFCEEAAVDFCRRHGLDNYRPEYLITSARVMSAVESGEVAYGVMAMENAQGGVVIESMYALASVRCEIVEMFHIVVEQCLLSHPGLAIGDITEIHSHPQALRQCRNYLADHFWTRPLVDEDDTAAAAKLLADEKLPSTAAVIGSRLCAQLYGLEILTEGIQDLKNNLTLFLGVKK
ncbi:MAG: prephenate dehydratase [Candidatus Marinimicrobia bacterium]|nr:prephenate dehydratase [Candidatus Neomarinimicrobiota bacterium]